MMFHCGCNEITVNNGNVIVELTWCICALLTSIYSQLSVENAIANRATATIAVIVAKDRVTAEQGILAEVCVFGCRRTKYSYALIQRNYENTSSPQLNVGSPFKYKQHTPPTHRNLLQ